MKLNYWRTLKVGLAFAVIQVFWTAYDYVVPLLLENTFGLSNSLRGLIMGADNLLSLFLLPIFGKISDKTNTKWGRRTPFIVLGTIASVIIMIFVPITSNAQLKSSLNLRAEITATYEEGYTYTDHEGKVYNAEELYTMLYNEGANNSDYCDRQYFKDFGGDSLEAYLDIALNPFKEGTTEFTDEYNSFVKTGINSYATDQIFQKITMGNITPLVLYMVVLLLVLIAMATFRSPAVALMPDVTPKPLRSQANAMINLAGGAGGAVAFLIYTITFMINPYGYLAIFIAVACAMLILLACYMIFVKEPVLFKECQDLCAEYGISNDDEDEVQGGADEETLALETGKAKKARMISFFLILASIFMWFMGYNAISSNLSIYITKTLGQSAGIGGVISGVSMGVSAVAFIPVGWLAVKIGRRKSIMLGFGLAVISYLLIFFFAATPSSYAVYLYAIFYLIAGFGLIIGNVNTFPMVVELSSNATIGKYTGLYYTATMSAQAITPFIAGLIMDEWGTKYLFLYSVVCVIISIALMFFVKHGDSKAVPKSALEMLGEDA
ncbi:MAG: MFS transporter [Clostridia bacterium]|nr:MFS transporter [Clostridia bacterium]